MMRFSQQISIIDKLLARLTKKKEIRRKIRNKADFSTDSADTLMIVRGCYQQPVHARVFDSGHKMDPFPEARLLSLIE